MTYTCILTIDSSGKTIRAPIVKIGASWEIRNKTEKLTFTTIRIETNPEGYLKIEPHDVDPSGKLRYRITVSAPERLLNIIKSHPDFSVSADVFANLPKLNLSIRESSLRLFFVHFKLVEGPEIAELSRKLAECNAKSRKMRSQYEANQHALQQVEEMLETAEWKTTIHDVASFVNDFATYASLALFIYGGAIALLRHVGAAGLGATGASVAEAGAGAATAGEVVTGKFGLQASAETAALMQSRAKKASDAYQLAQLEVRTAKHAAEVAMLEARGAKTVDDLRRAKEAVERAQAASESMQAASGLLTAAEKSKKAAYACERAMVIGSGGVQLVEKTVKAVKDADSRMFDPIKEPFTWDKATADFLKRIEEHKTLLREKQKIVAEQRKEVERQEESCKALAKELEERRAEFGLE